MQVSGLAVCHQCYQETGFAIKSETRAATPWPCYGFVENQRWRVDTVPHHFPVFQYACLWTPRAPQLALFINIACLSHLLILQVSIVLYVCCCLQVYTFSCQLCSQLLLKAWQRLLGCDAL